VGAICLALAVYSAPALSAETELETITVYAETLADQVVAQPVKVLEGQELLQRLGGSVGETLASEPGVNTTFFGPAVGRPVVHGLGETRVRVMEDRIDALDVSVTSGDHAVTIEPFIADRIEVLKGPGTLLYGSGAIGGVVNVVTGRIPKDVVEDGVTGRIEARSGSVNDERTGAGRLDAAMGEIAFHLDGFYRDTNDYEIPGESSADGSGDSGEVGNSDLETKGGAVGTAWSGERGFAGASFSRYESEYGLPGGEEEEGDVRLDMEQTRFDLEAGLIDPFAGVERIDARVGINDYEHAEIEGSGEVGTEFDNEAWEAIAELHHAPVAGWRGELGVQTTQREFSAIGEEAFIAPVDSESLAAYWVGDHDFGAVNVQLGARYEQVEHDPDNGASEDFSTASGSLGLSWQASEALTVLLQGDFASRAPTPEELFSNGPHIATAAFEVGDSTLEEEGAFNVALTAALELGRFGARATVYRTQFSDFIYQLETGEVEDDLPVRQWVQDDATFAGFEAETTFALIEDDAMSLTARVFFDTVTGELDDAQNGNDHLPRIPPSRLGFGLSGRAGIVSANIEYTFVDEQDDATEFESTTDDYENVALFVGADFAMSDTVLTVFVKGNNLTDEEQRLHTSIIKDLAPLPGRSILAGIRLAF